MTIGIMQPYFLPYIGYFQLMNAVDKFVYYDDVNYIKGGWINRNNIIIDNQPHLFTLELQGASSFKKINEIRIGGNREKLYKTFVQAYCKAPYYGQAEWLLYNIFHAPDWNLFDYILYTHKRIFEYLDLDIECVISSNMEKDNTLKGQDKVIDMCKRLGATYYFNAIGGQELYSTSKFMYNDIELRFIETSNLLPKTSIIDVIMNHSREEINKMLKDYELI